MENIIIDINNNLLSDLNQKLVTKKALRNSFRSKNKELEKMYLLTGSKDSKKEGDEKYDFKKEMSNLNM